MRTASSKNRCPIGDTTKSCTLEQRLALGNNSGYPICSSRQTKGQYALAPAGIKRVTTVLGEIERRCFLFLETRNFRFPAAAGCHLPFPFFPSCCAVPAASRGVFEKIC